jgi:Protein of unknown function DUF262
LIRIGPAGWSHKNWEVRAKQPKNKQDAFTCAGSIRDSGRCARFRVGSFLWTGLLIHPHVWPMKSPTLTPRMIRALRDPLLHDHKFAIPKLQRNFVWDAGRAAKLLDSIYYQMPIGSLFLWEMDRKSANLIRQATGVLPSFNPENKTISFVIDGQQRLSVIYQAFKAELREKENPARIVHRKPLGRDYVPISDILAPDWKKKMPSQTKWFLARVQNCRERFLNYPIPVVTVLSATLEEIGEVFIRVNSQGMRITKADRAVALMGQLEAVEAVSEAIFSWSCRLPVVNGELLSVRTTSGFNLSTPVRGLLK